MTAAYTPAQISQFLSRINIPPKYHLEAKPPRDLAFLSALHSYTISAIPYENLALHYSTARDISLDLQAIFEKIVLDGRGCEGK